MKGYRPQKVSISVRFASTRPDRRASSAEHLPLYEKEFTGHNTNSFGAFPGEKMQDRKIGGSKSQGAPWPA